MPNYDVDYFLKKFEAIPEAEWTTGAFTDCGKHCALGHCGSTGNHEETHTDEGRALIKLFTVGFDGTRRARVADVNDHDSARFPQKTPKARILAALHAVKANWEKDFGRYSACHR